MANYLADTRNKWFISRVREIEATGVSQADIAKKMGVMPQYLTPILSGKRNASEKLILKFCDIFNVNPNDLYRLIGKPIGLMTDAEMEQHDKEVAEGKWNVATAPPQARPTENPNEGIPLIPLDAMAGFATGEFQIMEYECERYNVPMFRGAEFLISVSGDSMTPKYNSGDVVACKTLPLNDLFFQWNKAYVIDTRQGALIKRIKRGCDDDHVLIVSDNPTYEPFELHRSKINAVALVIGVIRLE